MKEYQKKCCSKQSVKQTKICFMFRFFKVFRFWFELASWRTTWNEFPTRLMRYWALVGCFFINHINRVKDRCLWRAGHLTQHSLDWHTPSLEAYFSPVVLKEVQDHTPQQTADVSVDPAVKLHMGSDWAVLTEACSEWAVQCPNAAPSKSSAGTASPSDSPLHSYSAGSDQVTGTAQAGSRGLGKL